MEKEISAKEILEKLRWYHGEAFTLNMLNEDFLKDLESEQKGNELLF